MKKKLKSKKVLLFSTNLVYCCIDIKCAGSNYSEAYNSFNFNFYSNRYCLKYVSIRLVDPITISFHACDKQI